MIIIAGQLTVEAADRDGYVQGCVPVVDQARRSAGCLDFAITADTVTPDRINVYERWETPADLEAFRGSGPSAEQTAQITDAQVRRYLISGEADA